MRTHNTIATLFLLCLCVAPLRSPAATLDDFIGIRWGTSIEDARKIALSDRQRVLEKQENGITGSLSLRKGNYLGKPAMWWFLCFVNDKFCHGFVDFQLYRDQRPLSQLRQLRKTLVAKYGEPLADVDSHPNSDPSWEECFALKPVFKCDWHFTTSGPIPEASTIRLFLHGAKMEDASMRLVYGNTAMSEKRDKIEHDRQAGVIPAASPEDTQAMEAAVKETFEKYHAALKAGNGKRALEMHSKESLARMTGEQKASWLHLPFGRYSVPDVSSVSLRTKTAGVHYTLNNSRGELNHYFDFFLLEDGQWKLHSSRSQDRAPDDLARSLWLPPDTAPFIEGGEDWSKVETVRTGDPDWSVQTTADSVFLYIRFIHAADLPVPGLLHTEESSPSEKVYTPGVSIGTPSIREGIRLSVGEVIESRTIKKKIQSFVDYRLTCRRRADENCSIAVDNAAGVLKIAGRCMDIRIPREVLAGIPLKPLRIWITPKAPATVLEYTVKEPPRLASSQRPAAANIPTVPAIPAIPAPDPLADAKRAMRAIAARIIVGDSKAFDDLHNTADTLYQNIDYTKDRERLANNFALMRAAYDLLGEETAKGNAKAFDALKRSLGVRHLDGAAPYAMGIAAAAGHAESLQMLLQHDRYGILKSSAVFALRASAEKNNAQAIAFLLAVLDDPQMRSLWYGAAKGLAAAKDDPKVKAALAKYEEASKKPVAPPPAPAPATGAPLDAGKQTMRDLATRIAKGDEKAFDELRDAARILYRDIDYEKEKSRAMDNIALMHAAYDILGEQAGKGNVRAFDALKRSLGERHLGSFAPDALGIAAAAGHAEALQILLHHDRHGILKSTTVFALHAPAEKNNAQAIAFLLAVLANPADRSLWYGAAKGLAAAKDDPKVKAALEKYNKSGMPPVGQ